MRWFSCLQALGAVTITAVVFILPPSPLSPLADQVPSYVEALPPPVQVQVEEAPAAVQWKRGLVAWKSRNFALAAAHFAAIAQSRQDLSAMELAAASFWAWRAKERTGDADGERHLAAAAAFPHTFYGMLARKQRGESLKDRTAVIYSMPRWSPSGGFRIDPALIFAFAKEESDLHVDAMGSGGAIGLMQVMPETARHVLHREPDDVLDEAVLAEPRTNLQLGQAYLRQLLEDDNIDGNLIYLAAAYNAGPGTLARWQTAARYADDPLLFLETLPSSRTRAYVMRVMANYWAYQEAGGRIAESALALAKGNWPRYNAEGWQPPARQAHAG